MMGSMQRVRKRLSHLIRAFPDGFVRLWKGLQGGAPSEALRALWLQLPSRSAAVYSLVSSCGSAAAGGLLDLLYPPSCPACGSSEAASDDLEWCPGCLEALPWIRGSQCQGCGRPFPKSPSSPDHLCGECILGTFHFDRARSVLYHADFVRETVHAVKFGARLHLVRPLSQLLVRTVQDWEGSVIDLLIPVPLHPLRLRQRGFNQAALLGRFLSRKIAVPMDLGLLKRGVWTVPQTRLSREERLKNVKDAFFVENPERLEGRNVLLVDDVFTTGSTLSECAKVLKENGAVEVLAVTLSRAVLEQGSAGVSHGKGGSLFEDAAL